MESQLRHGDDVARQPNLTAEKCDCQVGKFLRIPCCLPPARIRHVVHPSSIFGSYPEEVGCLSTPRLPLRSSEELFFGLTTNDLLSCFPSPSLPPPPQIDHADRYETESTTPTTGKKHLNLELLHVPNLIHFDCDCCRSLPSPRRGIYTRFSYTFSRFPFRRESFSRQPSDLEDLAVTTREV